MRALLALAVLLLIALGGSADHDWDLDVQAHPASIPQGGTMNFQFSWILGGNCQRPQAVEYWYRDPTNRQVGRTSYDAQCRDGTFGTVRVFHEVGSWEVVGKLENRHFSMAEYADFMVQAAADSALVRFPRSCAEVGGLVVAEFSWTSNQYAQGFYEVKDPAGHVVLHETLSQRSGHATEYLEATEAGAWEAHLFNGAQHARSYQHVQAASCSPEAPGNDWSTENPTTPPPAPTPSATPTPTANTTTTPPASGGGLEEEPFLPFITDTQSAVLPAILVFAAGLVVAALLGGRAGLAVAVLGAFLAVAALGLGFVRGGLL